MTTKFIVTMCAFLGIIFFSQIVYAEELTSQSSRGLELITTILAIGTIIGPIFFGYILWKMNQVFVSKEMFAQYKESIEAEQRDVKEQLKQIAYNTSELLQRTAGLRKN